MNTLKVIVLSLSALIITACATVQSTINHAKDGVVAVLVETNADTAGKQGGAVGTGFFIKENFILTNNHVIESATKIEIAVESNETTYTAEVIYADKASDVAAIKIKDWEKFKKENKYDILPLTTSYDLLEDVYAIGHPWGLFWSVSKGIISKDLLQKPGSNNFFIQTDAHVYNGNSGGPLVDSSGHVIGINSNMIANEGGSYGLAIPTILVEKVMSDMEKYKEVRWAVIGVSLENGNVIKEIDPTKPAAQSELKEGDKIVSIKIKDGLFPVSTISDLIFRLSTIDYEEPVTLNVIRDGISLSINVNPTYKIN